MAKRERRLAAAFLALWASIFLGACAGRELLEQVPETLTLEQIRAQILQEPEESGEGLEPEGEETAVSEAVTAQAVREKRSETAAAGTGLVEESPGTGISFLAETAFPYAYHALSPAEQLWYRDMEQALGTMQETVRLSGEALEAGLGERDLDRIFQCVLIDHPEIFYTEGYQYSKYSDDRGILAIGFSGKYSLTPEEALERKRRMEPRIQEILAGISPEASDYEKVKYVYDTIIAETEYALEAPDNQNIYSVFVGKASVCQGYAKAAQLLLNRMGVDCTLVQGKVDTGEGHAWNLVRVDGSFYYMDVTWGDASYQTGSEEEAQSQPVPQINYDYLCITTKELLQTHIPEYAVALPECVATEANYYVRENALFSEYDKEQLEQLFARAREEGRRDVSVKCLNQEVYQALSEALISRQEIFQYFSGGSETVAYALNEKQLSLTFWVTN